MQERVAILDELLEGLGQVTKRQEGGKGDKFSPSLVPDLPLTLPIWRPDLPGFELSQVYKLLIKHCEYQLIEKRIHN